MVFCLVMLIVVLSCGVGGVSCLWLFGVACVLVVCWWLLALGFGFSRVLACCGFISLMLSVLMVDLCLIARVRFAVVWRCLVCLVGTLVWCALCGCVCYLG